MDVSYTLLYPLLFVLYQCVHYLFIYLSPVAFLKFWIILSVCLIDFLSKKNRRIKQNKVFLKLKLVCI